MTIFRQTNWFTKKINYHIQVDIVIEHKDSNGNKEKEACLTRSEASDWLQIWMAASLVDVKGNKAIKKNFVFLANW